MKKLGFISTILCLLILIIFFSYFIFVNVIFSKKVIPKVDVFGTTVSINTDGNLEEATYYNLINLLPSELIVDFGGTKFIIPKAALVIKIDSQKLVNYGKGSDILKVWKEGIDLASGGESINIEEIVSIDKTGIYNYLDYKIVDQNDGGSITLDKNGFVNNCLNNKLAPSTLLNEDDGLLLESFLAQKEYKFQLGYFDSNLVEACRKYHSEKDLLLENAGSFSNNFNNIFGIYIDVNGNPTWAIRDYSALYDSVNKLSKDTYIAPKDGRYEIVDNKIFLFESYSVGKSLNVSKTVEKVPAWINDPFASSPLIYEEIKPEVILKEMEVLDFTKTIGVGKSRIDIYRDGYYNIGLDRAQDGILELENTIVYPGEEFSYIKHINPQPNGLSINGRPIGSGICNATTTLFRAVLESGLPVTDRSYHAQNYDSYEWGYQMNIVDAAYLTNPVVDFKFVNDTGYPILIKIEITRPGDNWQYHNVYFYSSANAPTRTVEFYDWKKWNEYSAKVFEASFKRRVYQDGKELRTDEYYSRYW